jgi:hypothetical protein
MNWSEAIRRPSPRLLREFSGLWLVVFGGLAAWRAWGVWEAAGVSGAPGVIDGWTQALAAIAVIVGVAGLVWPAAVRPIYTGWMIAAFPIGWTISRVVLGGMFYLVFAPIGILFRLIGRDALHLRRHEQSSYWIPKPGAKSGGEYLRQY